MVQRNNLNELQKIKYSLENANLSDLGRENAKVSQKRSEKDWKATKISRKNQRKCQEDALK